MLRKTLKTRNIGTFVTLFPPIQAFSNAFRGEENKAFVLPCTPGNTLRTFRCYGTEVDLGYLRVKGGDFAQKKARFP